jgi:RNA polymerase sigma-70 factor (ECF subfamily)
MTAADPETRSAQPVTTVAPVPADAWDRPAGTGCADRSSHEHLEARLATVGPEREDAVRELHALMVRGCRHQVARMRSQLPGLDARDRDDLAMAAADDAVVALLAKLHTFEGRSRFTTWAYKFAILQAATEVRRQAWSRREVPLEDPDTLHWSAAGPAELAVATELAAEVGRALDVALTAYQRRIAVALLVDDVPIDVLAERLGTTRGALYKTLHVARTRVRAHLVATGHLEPPRRARGPETAGQDEGGGA